MNDIIIILLLALIWLNTTRYGGVIGNWLVNVYKGILHFVKGLFK